MELHCSQADLLKALSIVRRAVAPRSTVAILGNILLEAKAGELRVAATNLAVSAEAWIGATIANEGAITVPARLICDVVAKLLPGRVTLTLTERTQTLSLTAGNFVAKMAGLPAYDFPSTATPADAMPIELDPTLLAQMIDMTAFAATRDQSRQSLTVVQVTIGPRLTLAATDGYRLSMRGAPLDNAVGTHELLIPATSMAELGSLLALADADQPVVAHLTPRANRVTFAISGKDGLLRATLAAQLVDSKYPDYIAIIPKSHTTSVTIQADALLRALQVARLFAKDDSDAVTLTVHPERARLGVAAAASAAGDSQDELEATITGKAVTMMVDVDFLTDLLSRVGDGVVVLEMTQPTRPLVMRVVALGDEYIYVVMPFNREKK